MLIRFCLAYHDWYLNYQLRKRMDAHVQIAGALAAASMGVLCREAGLPVINAASPFISQVTWAALQVSSVYTKLCYATQNSARECSSTRPRLPR